MLTEGIIYKIVFPNEKCYVGSTTRSLKERIYEHKKHAIQFGRGRRGLIPVAAQIYLVGLDNIEFVEIKKYKVCDIKHLKAWEQLWINKVSTIGQNDSFRIKYITAVRDRPRYYENRKKVYTNRSEEKKKEDSLKRKEYILKNHEKINKKAKETRDKPENKDKKRLYDELYRKENKEKLSKKQKLYRENNKEKVKERKRLQWIKVRDNAPTIKCECGSEVKEFSLKNHLKTKKHINFMKSVKKK